LKAATAFARAWTAAYTIGLPSELRDRRRQEIASDLWEQQHDNGHDGRDARSARQVVARVVFGIPADLTWRSAELRQARRLELMNFAVDRTWDARMRWIGRAAIVAVIASCLPIAVGLPLLLAITLPVGALAAYQIQRRTKKVGTVTGTSITHQRRTRATIVGASVAIFAIGLFVDALPSSDVHDRYWVAFVAPMMIAFVVGVVALPMLVWSYLPRRHGPDGGSSARL
jgi:hypothetical protein